MQVLIKNEASNIAYAREQGIEQGLEETALRMVDKGFSVNDIADITGLAVKVVEGLMVGKR